jgi:hypothetical protein
MSMASIPTQDEVLAATRKSQEAMMAAVKTWLETVRTATPKLASVYAPLTDRLPKLPLASMPFADRLPTPTDAVANAYDLAEQLLASQRRFAEELVKATAPLLPGHVGRSAEVPSKSAWQEAVADSEPKAAAVPAPKPVAAAAVPAPKPVVAVPAAKPVAASEPKPVAASPAPKAVADTEPKPTVAPAAKSTPANGARKSAAARTPRTSTETKPAAAAKPAAASRPAAAKPAAKRTASSPTPKGTDAS